MDLYYGTDRHRGDEGYTLYTDDIARCLRTPINLNLTDPRGGEQRGRLSLDGRPRRRSPALH
ncbi:hypothetical protein BM536_000710 [Streptomyces phaeoluteigriseus]|uniref:Uncharacterized protein n=1 Tax=Streptomyces phaeoluteigriseus TaxID=114686 RepID=A0A1V6MZ59_9ACTN|nr:hypothetical protein [Streptomyces phaeoluteigriseus]OQD57665.1 hypothetical protein BM536_000710 [Streptomyces phaeoluteigriseus]